MNEDLSDALLNRKTSLLFLKGQMLILERRYTGAFYYEDEFRRRFSRRRCEPRPKLWLKSARIFSSWNSPVGDSTVRSAGHYVEAIYQ